MKSDLGRLPIFNEKTVAFGTASASDHTKGIPFPLQSLRLWVFYDAEGVVDACMQVFWMQNLWGDWLLHNNSSDLGREVFRLSHLHLRSRREDDLGWEWW